MINEIRINNVATYQTPAILGDLRPINYIFGANGTGKTTISRALEQADGHDHCQISWKNSSPLDVKVYNRDFVEKNFNQENPLQGVFTLGENQVEAEQEIANIQPEIESLTESINNLKKNLDGEDGESGKRKELSELEPALREKCFVQKRKYDQYFKEAFTGVRSSAESFKSKVLSERTSNSAELLTLDELKEKAETVFSSDIERAPLLSSISVVSLIGVASNSLLQKAIVGNHDVDIAALIERLGNSDWVKKGREYHQQEPNICPFCQQPTDAEFSKDLEAFFSEAYDNDIKALEQLFDNYKTGARSLYDAIQSNLEKSNKFLKSDLFETESQLLIERLKQNTLSIKAKIAEPSRKIPLESIEDVVTKLQGLITEANEATNNHNQTVANIAREKETLTSQVWRFVLNELDDVLSEYEQDKTCITNAIQGMESSLVIKQQQLRELQSQVRDLERQSTSIHPAKDAINELLQTFGFTSFYIDIVDDRGHYKICRQNGDDASRTLSEGEKTFITFLYFYSLIKGAHSESGITTNRVVVFDDPVSSLDSDILYIVSSLIKGVLEEVKCGTGFIKQAFLLTHNVFFHKEISFHKNRSGNNAMSHESFWMVKKHDTGSALERCSENPIRSAYELLWDDVRTSNLSSLSLQNTLRRILENYFTMWGGKSKDQICDLFDGRDKLICQSLFSWVNDGSHSIHDDLYINHGEQTNESYLCVFKSIFQKADQIGHYNMMVGNDDVSDNSVDAIDGVEDDQSITMEQLQ